MQLVETYILRVPFKFLGLWQGWVNIRLSLLFWLPYSKLLWQSFNMEPSLKCHYDNLCFQHNKIRWKNNLRLTFIFCRFLSLCVVGHNANVNNMITTRDVRPDQCEHTISLSDYLDLHFLPLSQMFSVQNKATRCPINSSYFLLNWCDWVTNCLYRHTY